MACEPGSSGAASALGRLVGWDGWGDGSNDAALELGSSGAAFTLEEWKLEMN